MVTKSQRKIHTKSNTDYVYDITDSDYSEKKPITEQDYKRMLQKRLYELESESMPAT